MSTPALTEKEIRVLNAVAEGSRIPQFMPLPERDTLLQRALIRERDNRNGHPCPFVVTPAGLKALDEALR